MFPTRDFLALTPVALGLTYAAKPTAPSRLALLQDVLNG